MKIVGVIAASNEYTSMNQRSECKQAQFLFLNANGNSSRSYTWCQSVCINCHWVRQPSVTTSITFQSIATICCQCNLYQTNRNCLCRPIRCNLRLVSSSNVRFSGALCSNVTCRYTQTSEWCAMCIQYYTCNRHLLLSVTLFWNISTW